MAEEPVLGEQRRRGTGLFTSADVKRIVAGYAAAGHKARIRVVKDSHGEKSLVAEIDEASPSPATLSEEGSKNEWDSVLK